jgi:signal transduction histidine kinase/DNA-binding response OmpR family regulator
MTVLQVLIVEDDANIASNLQRQFEKLGYRMLAGVSDCQEALVFLADGQTGIQPDLLLVDARLAGNGAGLEAFQAIKEGYDLPVVFLAANPEEAALQQARLTQPYGFLQESYREVELQASIEAALYKHAAERELRKQLERQYATIQQRLQESETIAEIGRSLLGTLNLSRVLQMIVESAHHLIPNVDRAVIHLLNQEKQTLEMAAASGYDRLAGPFFPILPGQGVAGKVLSEGRTINISDTRTDPIYVPMAARNPGGSLLVAPIGSSTGLLGTLSVRSSVVKAFSADHERLLTVLGVQAALAINNARLFEAEQKSRQLAETLLQQEKATRAQLVQTEKLAALGRIVASVAHELNNPLQAIQNAIYLVRMEETLNAQTQEDLGVALNETNRMADLIARLRETYRPAMREEFQAEAVNSLVEEVQKLLSTHMRHQNIDFHFQPGPDLPQIALIRDQLRQVIINISLNAVEAMSDGGVLTAATVYQPERDEVLLSFTDTGPGISEDILPFIFDPFFTAKEGGTGLGLAISYDIVQRHKGRIEVESQLGQGTIFRIWLPVGGKPREI